MFLLLLKSLKICLFTLKMNEWNVYWYKEKGWIDLGKNPLKKHLKHYFKFQKGEKIVKSLLINNVIMKIEVEEIIIIRVVKVIMRDLIMKNQTYDSRTSKNLEIKL